MMPRRDAARRRTIPSSLALLACLLAGGGALFAVSPVLWTQQGGADFEKGRPDGVAVTSRGGILLARAVKELPVKALEENAQPFLWAQAADSRGNLYVGSGNEGRVFKIPRGGTGTLFYSSGDLAVQALAADSRDNLYVGTGPEGKVYRLSPDGKAEVWFDPDERYIWALALDRSGNLYAATGEHGIIYKVTDKGKGAPFFDSEESHIVTLAFDRQGSLLAGSSGKGLLYRI
jgi:sugar lactone lactonase YvrE